MPIEKAYAIASQQVDTLERSFENLIGTTVRARVAEDESERYVFNSTSDIVMPVIIGDFNKNLAETYEGTRDTSGHWMNMRAVYGDSTTKSIWENIAHLNTFINRKFFGQESALEKYERDVVYGKSRKLWEHPVEDFLKPYSSTWQTRDLLLLLGMDLTSARCLAPLQYPELSAQCSVVLRDSAHLYLLLTI
jgi:hypothetical protein